ncbi:MAG: polysaccharide biosynthesis protein [Bacteroidota bacterium]
MSHLNGKSIAILGGSGTLGRALVKYVFNHKIDFSTILIFSRDEIKQLEMMEEFPEKSSVEIVYKLGDVRDSERLKEVINGFDYVVHAAAIKHVVMAEKNPKECHKTNVLGTQNVIEACLKSSIAKALLISTDKAVDPIGIYGKSKKEAERLWQKANTNGSTNFQAIRLGNIIGARGSVFEVFQRQRKTGTIKVTHPEATRFCISKEKAAEFIFHSIDSVSNKILIPKMESFKVIELAKQMAPECEIEIIGLRPGDKLHEKLREVSSNDTDSINLRGLMHCI